MKAVIQRVDSAAVSVDGKCAGSCRKGFMILLGVTSNDTEYEADLLAQKTANLRVFCDDNDKMNKSVTDVGGSILVVSQFTLCADVRKGNRPSFTGAMQPDTANQLYELYCEKLTEYGVEVVEKGVFGADMKVSLVNDGPVTIILDTDIWRKNGN